MQQGFIAENDTDNLGYPAGGTVVGTGFTISWQRGPLGRGDDRLAPNGAFVEDVIQAAIQRIEHYNEAAFGQFSCAENTLALANLRAAIKSLEARTARREQQEVEGTHEGS